VAAELSPEQFDAYKKQALALIAAQQYKEQHKREFVSEDDWYDWQHEGFECMTPQWMTMAANQVGKTVSEAYHFALDVTGDYPDWWRGYRYEHAPMTLALGVDAEQLKMVIQPELFGDVVEPLGEKKTFSGGWIHRDEIGRIEWSQITNIARRVEVITKYGRAMIVLRTSSQSKTGTGSLSFAGSRICRIWVDECPPDQLVGQLNVRTANGNMGRGGRIGYTMTPELGATELVTGFMEHRSDTQTLIGPVTWDQAPHMTEEKKATLLSGIPEHEKDMRTKGIPFFGEGLVYTCPDNRIKVEPFKIEDVPWLRFLRAIDLGITHPTAIAWLAYDPEIDRIYVLRTYSQRGDAAAVHAAAANSYLPWSPCVFPHDIDTHEKGSGKTLREYYREAGLKNTIDFKNPDGSIYVEPGILEIDNRMRNDSFKVFDTCEGFFREKRLYHRENGKIVALNDDILSAVRYGAIMIPRYGVPLGGHRGRKPKPKKRFKWSK
jgi:hypothetical protein